MPAEAEPVLGGINHLRGCTQDLDTSPVKGQGDVVWRLAADRDDATTRVLDSVDIKNRLKRDVLEVQSVGLIVIGGYGFGVRNLRSAYVYNVMVVVVEEEGSGGGAPEGKMSTMILMVRVRDGGSPIMRYTDRARIRKSRQLTTCLHEDCQKHFRKLAQHN